MTCRRPSHFPNAAAFPPVVPVSPPSAPEEPHTPVTLRSQAAPEGVTAAPEEEAKEEEAGGVADWEAPYPDSEDMP